MCCVFAQLATRVNVQKLRRQTGMVFQNFQLFPHQTAIGNVMEGLVTVLNTAVSYDI